MSMGVLSHNALKWDDRFYVKAYQLACSGMTDEKISKAIGVKNATFAKWVKERPALSEALEQARSRGAGTRAFMRLVGQKIPDDLKPLWEELSSDDHDKRAQAYKDVKQGDKRRAQHLFVHAFIACNFNENKAEDMTGIHAVTVAAWKRNDQHFKGLMEHIRECRKDFVENALMEKIYEGDTACIIMANKTLNKDRGYDSRITVDVQGEVEHRTTISVKDLPPDKLRELLELARRKKAAQLEHKGAIKDGAVDVEYEVKG
jgi:hypothetical protein